MTKPQAKVSIIVPIYGVEKYLHQCVDSILAQTLKDIEIILVDDGSKDKCPQIVDEYAKKDNRIVAIHQPNGGYGRAVNHGLKVATGEYIGIVESDDWIEPDAFEILYNAAKKNKADMVKADYVFFDNDTNIETHSSPMSISEKLKEVIFCPTEKNPDIIWNGHPSIWACLYSHKMLQNNKIKFMETSGASFQDMGFKIKTFAVSKRFYYLPKVILHYRKHANNSDKNNSKVFSVCDVHNDVNNWLSENRPDLKNLNQILNRCWFSNYLWNLKRLSGIPKKDFHKHFSYECKKVYDLKGFKKVYFNDKEWLKLLSIIHPYNPIYPILRNLIIMISPIYKVRVRGGYKIYYIFNKIILKKTIIPGVNHD